MTASTSAKTNSPLARLQRRHLLLDLSRARVPGYARINMDAMPFAYFQVRAAEGGFQLGASNENGQFNPLAFFTDEADARAVLAKIGKAYMRPHPILGFIGRVIVAVLVIFGMLLVLNYVAGFFVAAAPPGAKRVAPVATGPGYNNAAGVPAGVPVDADSKLSVPK